MISVDFRKAAIAHITGGPVWAWLMSAQKFLWQDGDWTQPSRFPCQTPHGSPELPSSHLVSVHAPSSGSRLVFTTTAVWRSLGQNNFLCSSLCRCSSGRTAALGHYQLWTNLGPRCEMEKTAPIISEAAHRSFLFHQGFEPNPIPDTPTTKDNTVAEF